MVRTDSGTTKPRSASPSRRPRSRRRRAARAPCTGTPLTCVPFIEPRSTTRKPSAVARISACGATPGGRRGVTVQSEFRPSTGGVLAEARPGGRRAGRASPPGRRRPRRSRPTTSKSPVFRVSSDTSVTVTGPDELVALLAGVLPGGLGELAGEGLGERLEALEVGRGRGRRRCCSARPGGRSRRACDRRRARG